VPEVKQLALRCVKGIFLHGICLYSCAEAYHFLRINAAFKAFKQLFILYAGIFYNLAHSAGIFP
jgi:hypothetical protein